MPSYLIFWNGIGISSIEVCSCWMLNIFCGSLACKVGNILKVGICLCVCSRALYYAFGPMRFRCSVPDCFVATLLELDFCFCETRNWSVYLVSGEYGYRLEDSMEGVSLSYYLVKHAYHIM